MYWIGRLTIAAAAAALIFAAAPVQAQTICVSPTKSNCEPTIQDGIDAASPGQRVQIQNGTYFENLVIPAGKDGLVLSGGSGAVLDPDDRYRCSATSSQSCWVDGDCPALETCDNVGTGDGINVEANNVEIRGFTIRNGAQAGIFLETGVTGTLINRMTISGSGSNCIDLDDFNNNTVIERNTLTGCGSDGVGGGGGNDILIQNNDFLFMDSDGVELDGNGIIVEKNDFNNVEDGTCVDIDGDLTEIVNNRCEQCDDYVVECDGNDCLVDRNRGTNCGSGSRVSGDDPIVTNNRFEENGDNDDVIDVSCNVASCSLCEVSRNRIDGTLGDTSGIDLTAAFDGCLIDRNTVDRVLERGIWVSGVGGGTVSNNKVTTAGGDSGGACYDINGGNKVVERNDARECFGHGYDISGDSNTVSNNSSRDTLEDGFEVNGGTGNTLSNNTAQDTNGAGFAITSGATNTSVDGNRTPGGKTRVDACNEGTNTTVGAGNDFDTVDPVCPSLL